MPNFNKFSHKLSVIVIFHNMRRESERTLYSLCTDYQFGVSSSDYEVIAVDSNSAMPLDEEFVKKFGKQFRYLNIKCSTPSPCKAMNLGVRESSNEAVMCIIDGARMLSPNILIKTLEAFEIYKKNPFIYTLAMHLGPKVQNESMLEGYNQEIEDQILGSINWRKNGYELFSVSSVALSSKRGFYSELSESNCFSLYKKTYLDLGGYDERFTSPGGGATNLDFFNRVIEYNQIEPVMLLGEATFHQFHGGVATNIPLKNHPWESFVEEYFNIRGKKFVSVNKTPYYYGEIRKEAEHLALK